MGIPALRIVTAAERAERAAQPKERRRYGAAVLADETDAELVHAMVQPRGTAGEQRVALEKLYRRHAEFAFRIALRLQGHSQDVDDVVHDAFLKAHRRIQSLKDPSAFRAWLGSIVVNEVKVRLRRARLMRTLRLQNFEPVDLDSLASADAGPEVRAQLAQVYGLLRLMPTNERIAWTLRHVERHRLEDVARLAGCSLATAKRRLHAAQIFIEEHFVRGTSDDRSTEERHDDGRPRAERASNSGGQP